ncbi:hypothetical protein ACFL6I_05225 [candidate division KSB1 bacterium]
MMNKKKSNIEKEIDLTLKELDHFEPIEASPFFYSKLTSRLNADSEKQVGFFSRFLSIDLLKPALLVLIVALNLFTVIKFLSIQNTQKTDPQDPFDNIAQSYATTTSVESIYYLNEE